MDQVQKRLGVSGHLTAISRKGPSAPLKMFLKNKIFFKRASILDYGCGQGADVRALKELGFAVVGYDPYWAPIENISPSDIITCTYVFNVLLPAERERTLEKIKGLLKPNGQALITVRRDFSRDYASKNGQQFSVTLDLPTIFHLKNRFETYVLKQGP